MDLHTNLDEWVSGMIRARVYNRIPSDYSSRGTDFGSNSGIYLDIINEIKSRESEIQEIHLALYLFNNVHLYNELLRLAKKGVRVTVISLPLTGYDRRKIKAAKLIYGKAINEKAIDLRIFPHMYIWYGAEYAGGGASYSFHIKAGIIEYKDETSNLFLTSANLAPGDPTHSETAVFMETLQNSSIVRIFRTFFQEVENRARRFEDYNKYVNSISSELQQVFDFSFVGSVNRTRFSLQQASQAYFTAPFITIGEKGSNHYARERLVKVILAAKKRLLVCAQHSHDISPFNGYLGETMISSITEAKTSNPDIDVKVLKQVSSSGLADKRRAAFVEGHLHHASVPQRVNKFVHDKFLVADNAVVITTGNFTATQFGWGERRMAFKTGISDLAEVKSVVDSAASFFGTPKGSVFAQMTRPRKELPKVKVLRDDIFSEVNAFMVVEDLKIADQLAEYFSKLWSHPLSVDVEIPR